MALLNTTIRRLVIALTGQKAANNVIGAVGLYGGCFITPSTDDVAYSTGDCSIVPDSGGAPCTYRCYFPAVNSQIQSIDWFVVKGFTPRDPSGVETLDALVTGYNQDSTTGQWYITIQVVTYGTGAAVDAVTSAGFVIGVRAAVTLLPTANPL